MYASTLWSGAELAAETDGSNCPDWVRLAYRQFDARLTASGDYPCHFGAQAQQLGRNWFTATERDPDRRTAVSLARTLIAYAEHSRSGPRRQSLIAFAGPPVDLPDFEDDNACFWRILAALSRVDTRPWPTGLPRDTQDPDWQWCFDGEPWFVFAGSPTNRARRSRHLGSCLTIIFQSMRVFEGLLDAKQAWHAAKRTIRQGIESYDTVPLHPHLGGLGDSASYRWRYAVLPDGQRVFPPGTCPFAAD